MKKKTVKTWVYGTLKRNKALHKHYMLGSKFIKEATIDGEMYKVIWYPVFFEKGKNKKPVKGEIFDMPLDDFKRVRIMEENSGYKAKELKTNEGDNVHVFCYMDSSVKRPGECICEF